MATPAAHWKLRECLHRNADKLAQYLSPYSSVHSRITETRVDNDQWGRPMLVVKSIDFGTVMPNVWTKNDGLVLMSSQADHRQWINQKGMWTKPTPLPPPLHPSNAMHHHVPPPEKWTMLVSSLSVEQRSRLENAKLLGSAQPVGMQDCVRVADDTPNAYDGFIERTNVYVFVLCATAANARERAVKGLNVAHFVENLQHRRGQASKQHAHHTPTPSVIIVSPQRMAPVPMARVKHELWQLNDTNFERVEVLKAPPSDAHNTSSA